MFIDYEEFHYYLDNDYENPDFYSDNDTQDSESIYYGF